MKMIWQLGQKFPLDKLHLGRSKSIMMLKLGGPKSFVLSVLMNLLLIKGI